MLPLPSKLILFTVLVVFTLSNSIYNPPFLFREPEGAVSSSTSLSQLTVSLYSQRVFSSPAAVHVSPLKLDLTAAGAVGYNGKEHFYESQIQFWEQNCWSVMYKR